MDSFGWTSVERAGALQPAPNSGVQWRRRGPAVELRFDEPVGGRMWKKNMFGPGAIPVMWAIGGGILGLVGFGAAALIAAGIGIVTGLWVPWWLGTIAGFAAVPVGAIAGFFMGKKRQEVVRSKSIASDRISHAVSAALSNDYKGFGAKSFLQKIVTAMRTGQSQTANVLSTSGNTEYRIDLLDDYTVRIEPQEQAKEVSWFNDVVKSLPIKQLTGQPEGVTAAADRRMAVLEERLEAIQKVGNIDTKHLRYPQFITLQVDRLTEYHHLSSRANAVASLGTDDSKKAAAELVEDLERIIELMRVGVDELEQFVLIDSQIDSDAHLLFLRDKYERVTLQAEQEDR